MLSSRAFPNDKYTNSLVPNVVNPEFYRESSAKLSEMAKNAFQDLGTLGYDIEALARRNMNEEQVLELRDKAFKFRGMEVPSRGKDMTDLVNLFELGVDLSLRSPPAEARIMARNILYLAEKQLSES